ncbi:DUF3908 family protein [Paenibacillus senegalimassiliensis]|uniref:DUF3908 family protein n=1 Tax=Paenibacillus senegalimassiliensis TaxID=1737426 RepID=UPI00073F5EE1|nr:DUF3908 family protein [Paenibacillus senegalimassiliensis]
MPSEMSFGYLTSVVMDGAYSDMRKHRLIVKTMLEFVEADQVKGFYPKNLFSDNQSLECFVFTDNKLLIFKEFERHISINVLKLNQITAAILEREKDDFPDETVKLSFSTGEEIAFVPKSDSNSHWYERFKENANEIFKLICKAP